LRTPNANTSVPSTAALAELVDDPFSALHGKVEEARNLIREILFDNPRTVHHIPV
jgi:hypothetical protein